MLRFSGPESRGGLWDARVDVVELQADAHDVMGTMGSVDHVMDGRCDVVTSRVACLRMSCSLKYCLLRAFGSNFPRTSRACHRWRRAVPVCGEGNGSAGVYRTGLSSGTCKQGTFVRRRLRPLVCGNVFCEVSVA